MNGNSAIEIGAGNGDLGPHSLGKLIEWKRNARTAKLNGLDRRPHSLGKLIEWKLTKLLNGTDIDEKRPHSLGTLIEWKRLMSAAPL